MSCLAWGSLALLWGRGIRYLFGGLLRDDGFGVVDLFGLVLVEVASGC